MVSVAAWSAANVLRFGGFAPLAAPRRPVTAWLPANPGDFSDGF